MANDGIKTERVKYIISNMFLKGNLMSNAYIMVKIRMPRIKVISKWLQAYKVTLNLIKINFIVFHYVKLNGNDHNVCVITSSIEITYATKSL